MRKKIIFVALCGILILGNVFPLNQDSGAEAADTDVQEADIFLPPVTTYVGSSGVEQKQTFSAEEIEALAVEDLPSLLQNSGIQILQYGPYGLEQKPSIRGFTDETVRVVVDGVCLNNAQYGTFDFSSINIDSIEKIEIVRGGFTEGVEDEGAVGGVIYITTKNFSGGQNFSFETRAKTFFYQEIPLDTISQKLNYSGQLGENSFLNASLAGTFAENKFFYRDDSGALKIRRNSEVKDGNANVRFRKFFGNGNYFTLSDAFYYGRKNIPGAVNSTDFGKQKDRNNVFSADFFIPAVKNLFRLKSSFSWINTKRNYEDISEQSEHLINDFKFSSSADFFASENFSNKTGISLECVHLDSTNTGKRMQLSGVLKNSFKFFFGREKNFAVSVPMGVKFAGSNVEFIPKIGMEAKFSKTDFFLSVYRMIQFPTLDDLFWRGNGFSGNENLNAEKGIGADFTVNVHDVFLPFSLGFFSNFYTNKIKWSYENSLWSPQNVSDAFYFGIDFFTEKSLFNGILVLSFNGEYLYTALLGDENSNSYKKRIMWTPDFTATAGARLDFEKFNFTLCANYVGKRYTSNLNIYFLEPYILFDFVAEANIWKKISLFCRLENIFDTEYFSVENYPMPGRSLTIGLKGKF